MCLMKYMHSFLSINFFISETLIINIKGNLYDFCFCSNKLGRRKMLIIYMDIFILFILIKTTNLEYDILDQILLL